MPTTQPLINMDFNFDAYKPTKWQIIKSGFYRIRTKVCETVYSAVYNKYKIESYGYCPVQAEGQLPTGEHYYYRSRWSSWSVRIANTEAELWPSNGDKAWVYSEQKYNGHSGGWVGKIEVIRNFNKAVAKYYSEKAS